MNTDANKEQRALEHIQSVVDKLLDPEGGCPWDRAQTPVSLCEYIIEECHELVDAIRSGKPGHACDEMGDLLFLLIITARRFADAGSFSLADALNAGADKMTRRHPPCIRRCSLCQPGRICEGLGGNQKGGKSGSGRKGRRASLLRTCRPASADQGLPSAQQGGSGRLYLGRRRGRGAPDRVGMAGIAGCQGIRR